MAVLFVYKTADAAFLFYLIPIVLLLLFFFKKKPFSTLLIYFVFTIPLIQANQSTILPSSPSLLVHYHPYLRYEYNPKFFQFAN